MAAVQQGNQMQCSICGLRQVVPQPREALRIVRFCVARWPQRLCMFCCTCNICVALCIYVDVQLYKGLTDNDFNTYIKRQDGEGPGP